MYNDSLYRISLKCFIANDKNEVLVVKEIGRNTWELPGGGMEHGESIKLAIARELKEEVGYEDDFEFEIMNMEEPKKLQTRDTWQVMIVFKINPFSMNFGTGVQADAIQFVAPDSFKESEHVSEYQVYKYSAVLSELKLSS